MSGRGEGYCALELPELDRPARGYVGLAGTPVRLPPLAAWLTVARYLAPWVFPAISLGWAFRRGRGRGGLSGGRMMAERTGRK